MSIILSLIPRTDGDMAVAAHVHVILEQRPCLRLLIHYHLT